MTGNTIYLISGTMAAGKTTVARLLAARFDRGVHLEGDFFRRNIVAGRHEMTPEPSEEALAQLRLRYRLTAQAADAYFAEGLCGGYGALYGAFRLRNPALGCPCRLPRDVR